MPKYYFKKWEPVVHIFENAKIINTRQKYLLHNFSKVFVMLSNEQGLFIFQLKCVILRNHLNLIYVKNAGFIAIFHLYNIVL